MKQSVVKRSRGLLFVILFILFFAGKGFSQFNLNKFNGLPSDHVYMFLKDQYGYLWIATNKGILRYNGYELKTFNTSQELGSNDIWRLYRDRLDRIWLFTFSKSFGYIYKNKYYKVLEEDEVITPPGQIFESEAGLVIPSQELVVGQSPAGNRYTLYHELYPSGRHRQTDSPVYAIQRNGNRIGIFTFNGHTFIKQKECTCAPGILPPAIHGNRMQRFSNHLFLYMRKKDRLVKLNLDNCGLQVVFDYKDRREFSYMHSRETKLQDYLYVFYNKHVDKLDSGLRVVRSFPVAELTRPHIKGYDLVYLLEDSLWGTCVASESHGAFITPNITNPFRKNSSWNAAGYVHLATLNDSSGYWWNENTHTLIRINSRKMPQYIQFNSAAWVYSVLPFNEQYDNLFMHDHYCLLDKRTGTPGPAIMLFNDTNGITRASRNKQYIISNRGVFAYVFMKHAGYQSKLLSGRFSEVVNDPVRHGHWAYSQHSLYFIDRRDSCLPMNSLLKKLGITQLEKFLTDPYGNMLFLTPGKLLRYDPASGRLSELLQNCNLSGARLALSNNRLVAAGRFGVAFIRIEAPGKYSSPVICHNIKNEHYSFVNAMQVFEDELLLQTDAATYTVAMPGKNQSHYTPLPYKFLLRYNDSLYEGPVYHIHTDQQSHVLLFDLIRPAGNGVLKYSYRMEGLDSVWKELNANELVLPELDAGEVYTLSVIARDDVWQSNAVRVQIYVKPFWWQTTPGSQITWIAVTLLALGILFLTVLTTRNMIERRTARQKQLLELELKAVYAQINPHFIFNTLNSGLQFIKKQKTAEAYNHILRFSQLLRAYLKASRHRYITLAEEITNLRNYIELQQTRFPGMFGYSIELQEIPRPGEISIPSLLLQPVVENAIVHGLLPNDKNGHLDIRFSLDVHNKQLTCTVSDDGIGRRRSKMHRQDHSVKKESYGDDLIKELINLFNKYEKMGIEITYEDRSEPYTGTVVNIVIRNPHISYE